MINVAEDGFEILYKDGSTFKFLYRFRHRLPWNSFTSVKDVPEKDWRAQLVTESSQTGLRNPAVTTWTLQAPEGVNGAINWMAGDNIMFHFNPRHPGTQDIPAGSQGQIVLNSNVDKKWQTEERPRIHFPKGPQQ